MTREHKLALIVGFSLILVIGVLISDHLSRAREARVAAVQPVESIVMGDPVPARPDPRRLVPPTYAAADPSPAAEPAILQPTPTEPVLTEVAPAPAPALADTGAPGPEAAPPALPIEVAATPPGDPEAAGGVPPVVEIPQGRYLTAEPEPAPEADLVRAVTAMGARVIDGEIHLPPAAGMVRPPTPAVLSQSTVLTEPVAPIRWHTVKKGESLFQIARRYYGDGKHWPKLAAENADTVGRDGSIRVGVRLRIPDPADLGIAAAPAKAEPAERATPAKPQPKAQPKSREPAKPETRLVGQPALASYTVKKGDTLGEIAQRVLGSAKRKNELLALNKDRIKDEDTILVGMVLRVPAER